MIAFLQFLAGIACLLMAMFIAFGTGIEMEKANGKEPPDNVVFYFWTMLFFATVTVLFLVSSGRP